MKVELGLADGITVRQLSSDGRPGSSWVRSSVLCRRVVAYRDTVHDRSSWSLPTSLTSLMTGLVAKSAAAARSAAGFTPSLSLSTQLVEHTEHTSTQVYIVLRGGDVYFFTKNSARFLMNMGIKIIQNIATVRPTKYKIRRNNFLADYLCYVKRR